MAWLAYILAIVLFMSNFMVTAMFVFMVGMVIHWKGWLAIIGGFFIGFNWNKLFG